MIKYRHKKQSESEAGISLMEMLLTVGVMSLLLVMVMSFFSQYVRDARMQSVADYMALVGQAIYESTDSISEFAALHEFVSLNGGQVEISILDPGNGNRTVGYNSTQGVSLERGNLDASGAPRFLPEIPANMVINAGFLPSGSDDSQFRDMLPIESSFYAGNNGPGGNDREFARLTLLVRTDDRAGQKQLEFLLVSVDRVTEENIRSVAAKMDPQGGFLSGNTAAIDPAECLAGSCDHTVRGAMGSWMTHVDLFNATNWYNTAFSTAPPTQDEGYLAYYFHVNAATLAGDYLYRKATPGSPELNTMYTNLDLGGNNIIGADNVTVTGSDGVEVTQSVFAQGAVYTRDSLNVIGDMIVDGTVSAGDTQLAVGYTDASGRIVNISNSSDPDSVTHGNILVEGEFMAQNMNISDRASVGGNATVGSDIQLYRGSAPQGNIIGHRDLNVQSANGAFTQEYETGSLEVENQTLAQSASTRDITTKSLGTFSAEVGGSMRVEGDSTTRVYGTNNLSSRGTVILCERGCDRCDSGDNCNP